MALNCQRLLHHHDEDGRPPNALRKIGIDKVACNGIASHGPLERALADKLMFVRHPAGPDCPDFKLSSCAPCLAYVTFFLGGDLTANAA
ncbi:hypothetical protein PG985_011794 [Apiospora marii]|uniref:uncharacterized protein n=1 Tax=Apiospora marii TaxID=335849 RepID=UPI00312FB7AC